ncbi:MAG: hypothetical protein A2076_17390 [Geobacteraceae bacterium GWC2_53_11]|nr:MAG: hypothetical protein A2076_17390 [Geobacteraceae bacterium GWC2_53_11]
MKKTLLSVAFMLISIGSSSAAQDTAPAVQTGSGDRIVATVNGQPVKTSDVESHAAATHQPREEALEDIINMKLLRAALAAHKISVPAGEWGSETAAKIEFALAQAMSIDVPPLSVTLIVDHAWLKDAEDEKVRVADRARLEQLRALVVAGATIPDAYTQLIADGSSWHIGDHEEYLALVLPVEVHNLQSGSLSAIIPGDGGLHLFKIHQRKEVLPPRDEVRNPLFTILRLEATIELPEESTP